MNEGKKRLNTRRYVTILVYMLPISMLTSFTKSVLKLFQVIPYIKKKKKKLAFAIMSETSVILRNSRV